MKVKELIEQLKQQNPEYDVVVSGAGGSIFDVAYLEKGMRLEDDEVFPSDPIEGCEWDKDNGEFIEDTVVIAGRD